MSAIERQWYSKMDRDMSERGKTVQFPGRGDQKTSTTATASWPVGVREGEGGREGSRSSGVVRYNPGLVRARNCRDRREA